MFRTCNAAPSKYDGCRQCHHCGVARVELSDGLVRHSHAPSYGERQRCAHLQAHPAGRAGALRVVRPECLAHEYARGLGLIAEGVWTDDHAELSRYAGLRGIVRGVRGQLFGPLAELLGGTA